MHSGEDLPDIHYRHLMEGETHNTLLSKQII